jgi:hypothetical protein
MSKVKTEPCPFCQKYGAYCCKTWIDFCSNLKTGNPNLRYYYLKDGKYVPNNKNE